MNLFSFLSPPARAGILALLLPTAAVGVHAQILLTIDVSDPGNVIITATGASAAVGTSPFKPISGYT